MLLVLSCWNWGDYWRTTHWIETTATIKRLDIHPYRPHETLPKDEYQRWDGHDGRLECVYEYSFEGSSFTGSRIGVETFGNSHLRADRFQRLQEAFALGQPIEILINPHHPEKSAIYREIDGDMIFHPALAIFWFTTGGIYIARDRHRRKREAEQDATDQPATRPESKSEDNQKPQPESEGRPR